MQVQTWRQMAHANDMHAIARIIAFDYRHLHKSVSSDNNSITNIRLISVAPTQTWEYSIAASIVNGIYIKHGKSTRIRWDQKTLPYFAIVSRTLVYIYRFRNPGCQNLAKCLPSVIQELNRQIMCFHIVARQ